MQEEAIGEFFGFTSDEIRFVIDYLENAGYARRGNGRVYLSESGHALFVDGEEPRLFEVHSKQELFEFDLISSTPADVRKGLTQFEHELPELPLEVTQDPGQTSKRIFQSFSRFFQEFRSRRGGSRLEKQSLYTVDDVQPELRYNSIIPVKLLVRADDPAYVEINLLDWRSGAELEDRATVVQSCAKFASSIHSRSDELSKEAIQWLVTCAPEQTQRFIKNDTLDVEGFFRACVRQAGELRVDRPTVRIVGNLWTEANRTRMAAALRYAVARPHLNPKLQIWLRPNVPHWGATTRLPELLAAVDKQFHGEGESERVRSVLIGEEHSSPIFNYGFNAVLNIMHRDLPAGLELFLVPGQVCYIAIHSPIGSDDAYPIPVGVLSFDPKITNLAQQSLSALLSRAYLSQSHCDWDCADVRSNVEQELARFAS